jgi:hypothetical protein
MNAQAQEAIGIEIVARGDTPYSIQSTVTMLKTLGLRRAQLIITI